MSEKTEIKKNGEQAIAYLGEYIYNTRNSRLYKSMMLACVTMEDGHMTMV